MTTKSDYTPEQWQLLLDVPPLVGTAVMVAGRSGLGSMKEAFALAKGVLDGKNGFEHNELIAALVDARMKDGDRSKVETVSDNPYRGMSPEEILTAVLDQCGQLMELLESKSTPQESLEVRQWAISVGDRVAQAAKEGGFLGVGGERVSPAERDALEAISRALDVPSHA